MTISQMEAMYYEKGPDIIHCRLCPQHCHIKEGRSGLCRVRSNRKGTLITHNYGEVSSLALDPVEKKPLLHFYPGSMILSVGTFGCNLACSFCQNWSIAQNTPPTRCLHPDQLVDLAVKSREEGSIGVAFTYNEPSIWYEYIWDCAPRLQSRGLKTVLVSNAYLEREPLEKLLPFLDAINIDVKAFNEGFYRSMCRGRLDPVKNTVERLVGKTHIEITTLLIPGYNDAPEEIEQLAAWLAGLDKGLVLHLSRYHPSYKLEVASTPTASIRRARDLARKHLNFVYTGNLPGEENETKCLQCAQVLIKRNAYYIEKNGIKGGRCCHCNASLDYIIGLT